MPGDHQRGEYPGFNEEQHDKDVTGNNALIDQLEQEIAQRESEQKSDEEEKNEEESWARENSTLRVLGGCVELCSIHTLRRNL